MRVVLDGRERPGRAEYEDRPEAVVRLYKKTLDEIGYRKASMLGLKVNVDRSPTLEEMAPAVQGRGVARIRLTG